MQCVYCEKEIEDNEDVMVGVMHFDRMKASKTIIDRIERDKLVRVRYHIKCFFQGIAVYGARVS